MGVWSFWVIGILIIAKSLGSRWMAELSDGFGFDLTDTLTGNTEFFADFLKGPWTVVIKTITESENSFLTIGQIVHDFV